MSQIGGLAVGQDDEPPSLPKDRFFNPRRYPATDKAKGIVADILNQVQNLETYHGLRKRQRKPQDQAIFEAAITAIACDLMHHHVAGSPGEIAITRSNRFLGTATRYRHPALSKTLPALLDTLARPEMAFISQTLGQENPFVETRRTAIRPGERLLSRIEDHGVSVDDFCLQPFTETIVLKRKRADYWDEGGEIDYDDTTTTTHFREQVRQINAWLSTATLTFDQDVSDRSYSVDTQDRHLRRIFSRQSFENGGRLFGGFWQPLTKRERREGIRIDGEAVAALDFGQMNPRILYGLVEAPLPNGDLYAVPGLESCRTGVKKVMNAMFFAEKPLTRFPKGTRQLFSDQFSFNDVVGRVEAAHPALRPLFYTGAGHRAMFIESQIMVELLLDLIRRKIVALPIHDAIIVTRSNVVEAKDRMLSLFQLHTGMEGIVSEE